MKKLWDNQWHESEYDIGSLALTSGQQLPNARLRYQWRGALNTNRDNLVVLPTHYGGAIAANHAWVDDAASPLRHEGYCVVVPALFGNGESSSPSHWQAPLRPGDFPQVSVLDNICAQEELIDARFGGARIALVAGWSMGGMQALQWAAHAPERVDRVLATCATARCYPHNALFLEGVKAALQVDPAFTDDARKIPEAGLRAFARVYAGWAYSQRFFRDSLYRTLGFDTIDALVTHWETDHLQQHAHDLLAMLHTWQDADIGANPPYGSKDSPDTPAALAAVKAKTILMPSSTDLYFTAEDAVQDAAGIPNAECRPLISDFGHVAGGPGREPASMRAVFAAMSELLDARPR